MYQSTAGCPSYSTWTRQFQPDRFARSGSADGWSKRVYSVAVSPAPQLIVRLPGLSTTRPSLISGSIGKPRGCSVGGLGGGERVGRAGEGVVVAVMGEVGTGVTVSVEGGGVGSGVIVGNGDAVADGEGAVGCGVAVNGGWPPSLSPLKHAACPIARTTRAQSPVSSESLHRMR